MGQGGQHAIGHEAKGVLLGRGLALLREWVNMPQAMKVRGYC